MTADLTGLDLTLQGICLWRCVKIRGQKYSHIVIIYDHGPHTSNDDRLIFRSRLCEISFHVIHAMGLQCTLYVGEIWRYKKYTFIKSSEVFLGIQQNSSLYGID